jgi:hypothetical protein
MYVCNGIFHLDNRVFVPSIAITITSIHKQQTPANVCVVFINMNGWLSYSHWPGPEMLILKRACLNVIALLSFETHSLRPCLNVKALISFETSSWGPSLDVRRLFQFRDKLSGTASR